MTPTTAEFRTEHAAAGYACALTRRISLQERTLVSFSALTNRADRPMHLQWFAHPFFALDAERTTSAILPRGSRVPPDFGFSIDADATLRPDRAHTGKDDGAFALLELPPDLPLDARIAHPGLPHGIRFSTTFVPSECPVWVNGFTVSIEPYQVLHLAPGESVDWELRYTFG